MQQISTTAPPSSPLLDAELQAKAARLKASRLFVNPSHAVASFEKQLIFLVLAGELPVVEISSAADPHKVGEFLASLRLKFYLTNTDSSALEATVSLRAELVDEMVNASDLAVVGRLFGYPETAARAFEQGEEALLPLADQHRIEATAGLPPPGAGFSFSREHWRDELAVVERWYAILHAYGF